MEQTLVLAAWASLSVFVAWIGIARRLIHGPGRRTAPRLRHEPDWEDPDYPVLPPA